MMNSLGLETTLCLCTAIRLDGWETLAGDFPLLNSSTLAKIEASYNALHEVEKTAFFCTYQVVNKSHAIT